MKLSKRRTCVVVLKPKHIGRKQGGQGWNGKARSIRKRVNRDVFEGVQRTVPRTYMSSNRRVGKSISGFDP